MRRSLSYLAVALVAAAVGYGTGLFAQNHRLPVAGPAPVETPKEEPARQTVTVQRPLAPPVAVPAPAAQQPDAEDISPEERVNMAVYQTVNRGVVNITTRSVQVDDMDFFSWTVPGEGTGSGS